MSSAPRDDGVVRIQAPLKLKPLWQPCRYKGAYGGRGGGKSHFFAEKLIVKCFSETLRAACIREVQNSIKDSVRQLLIDKIDKMGLGYFFEVLDQEIRGKNGSLIIFKGMQSYNAENIKSLEGFDIAWVEEAQTLSAKSLRLLNPTIRKERSELWFSWNPRYDDDPVDRFFRGGKKRTSMVCVECNWDDNPFFPAILLQEKDDDYAIDPEMAEHVWGGGYEIISEGAYYAKLLHAAEKEGRIGPFGYNPRLPVDTAWDIGVDDYTAIWFIQNNGRQVFLIDYYEVSGEGAEEIVKQTLPELNPDVQEAAAQMLEIGRKEPFVYGGHWLPHDVKNREWGAGGKERSLTLMGFGVKPLHVGVATNPANRIAAVRKLLPVCYFNDTSRVQVGLQRLRRYSRRWNESMQTYGAPLHDENSHGSDAFGEYAINNEIRVQKPKDKKKKPFLQPGVLLEGAPRGGKAGGFERLL